MYTIATVAAVAHRKDSAARTDGTTSNDEPQAGTYVDDRARNVQDIDERDQTDDEAQDEGQDPGRARDLPEEEQDREHHGRGGQRKCDHAVAMEAVQMDGTKHHPWQDRPGDRRHATG